MDEQGSNIEMEPTTLNHNAKDEKARGNLTSSLFTWAVEFPAAVPLAHHAWSRGCLERHRQVNSRPSARA